MASRSSSATSRTEASRPPSRIPSQGANPEKPTSPASSPESRDVEKAPSHAQDANPNELAPALTHDPAYEVSFDGPQDPYNPRRYSDARKWLIVLVCSGTSLCVTCTSSLYVMIYEQVEPEFGVSEIVATLGLSLFVAGLGISPMILGPWSEFYGRKPIYIFSLLAFVIWLIPCAVAQNIQTLLVARFLNGFAGSAFLTVSGGTVGDLFEKSRLQAPMMVFTASPFLGPVVGPIVGGFINEFTNWRWSFYVLIIWSVIQWLLVTLLVPETYHPVLLRKKARKLREETGDSRWYAPMENTKKSIVQTITRSCYRPFQLLTLEPMCLNLCLFSAILLGILYLFFGAFNIVFTTNHSFSLWQVGMSFCGIGVGMALAIASDPLWQKNYLRLVKQKEKESGESGASEPEYRLPPAIAGAPLVTIGLFWFGWTTYPTVHWIVPIIGSALFGAGVILVFSGIFTFLVEAYPLYAASALAANSFARSSFAAAFPLFGPAMYNNLGYQWATTILAFLSLAMLPFPYIFFRYGKRIRGHSKFASGDK